jgi:hypothetical protein
MNPKFIIYYFEIKSNDSCLIKRFTKPLNRLKNFISIRKQIIIQKKKINIQSKIKQ